MATVAQQKAAKEHGKLYGYHMRGSMVYSSVPTEEGHVYNDWSGYWNAFRLDIQDELTQKYTRYKSFSTLVRARGSIKLPEAKLTRSYACTALADTYDNYMRSTNDPRRAQRG